MNINTIDIRNTMLLLVFTFFGVLATAQGSKVKYDKKLADSLGADEYGMKMYVLVLLKTGPANIEDKAIRDSLLAGHLKNIRRLAALGKLAVAGPLEKNDRNYRGIFILNVRTIEEATGLLETDPTIKAKFLVGELYQWYGSAALPMYLPYSEQVEKKSY
jgi:uncharacterized protein YciI